MFVAYRILAPFWGDFYYVFPMSYTCSATFTTSVLYFEWELGGRSSVIYVPVFLLIYVVRKV